MNIWMGHWDYSMKLRDFDVSKGYTVWIYGSSGKNKHVEVILGDHCKK